MYIKKYNAHTSESGTYSQYEKGMIQGNYRTLPAIVVDNQEQSDDWHIVNIMQQSNGSDKYFDSIAINGAYDSKHAQTIANKFINQNMTDDCYTQVVANADTQTWSLDSISKLVNNPDQDKSYLPAITAQRLQTEVERTTYNNVQWDGFSLVSHDQDDGKLMLDMVKCDPSNELVAQFDFVDMLEELEAEQEESYDSIMDTKSRLPLLKDRLFNAMSRASTDTLSVTNVTMSTPFTRGGVANISFVFDLSDGQSLSIWFHNPDSTPNKLLPKDIMISWKWLLNKRDVTGVLQPKHGENVKLETLAKRMMKVAHKNSKRFTNAQKKRAENEKAIAEAQAKIEEKTLTIEQLDKDIEMLQASIAKANAEKLQVNVVDENISTDISGYLTDKDGNEVSLYQAVNKHFKENLQGKIVKTQIGDVHLRGSTIKKMRMDSKKDEIKSRLIPFVPQILKNNYDGSKPLKEPRTDGIIRFHSFSKEITIDNQNVQARVLVGERENGEFIFTAYSLHKTMLDSIFADKVNPLFGIVGKCHDRIEGLTDQSDFGDVIPSRIEGSVNNIANDENNVNQFDKVNPLTEHQGKRPSQLEGLAEFDTVLDSVSTIEGSRSQTASNPVTNNIANDNIDVNQFDSIADGEDGWNIEIIKITDKDGNDITDMIDKPLPESNGSEKAVKGGFENSAYIKDIDELKEFLYQKYDEWDAKAQKKDIEGQLINNDSDLLEEEYLEDDNFKNQKILENKTYGYARALLTELTH